MIVPHAPQLRRLLEYVGMPLLLLFLWDGAIVLLYKVAHWDWVALPHIPLALLGSSIGLIVAFRNNSSYGRWWEARTIWGGIVNNSRSWARQVLTAIAPQKNAELEAVRTMQVRMVYLQIAWVHALRQQLRGLPPLDELHGLLTEDDLMALKEQKNVAFTLQLWQGDLARKALENDWVDSLQWSSLDGTLNDLIDFQGASERIKNTPMPKQYDFYPQLFVKIFCLLLPLGLVQNMGWFTPLGSTIVGFIFIALDKIGRDLEDPFNNTIYDIPLTAMSRTIEINLRQSLGERSLPAASEPVHGVLW
ncbi:bestrophin family protein [Terriglobus sp. TAA 43]|uniref:bestrophin family protein n=1 Tax=Terriglobus sp. TAA 43 TaxID=278961 RepID=UPI0006463D45|nr:bestrophin family ion channel [Terriglobus sp. TAA 43]